MREFAKLHCSMSDDPDFNALGPDAQLVYFRLTIRPQLSRVGVTNLAPGLLAAQTSLLIDRVERALDELDRARFIVCDYMTGELLVRAKLRHSGYSNGKHETGALAEAGLILSARIRDAVITEAGRMGWDWTHLLPAQSPPCIQPTEAVSDTQSDTQPEALSDSALSESLNSESLNSESEKIGRDPGPDPPLDIDRDAELFAALWADYPRRVDRGAALKAYRALRRRHPATPPDSIHDAVRHYAAAMKAQARAPAAVKHAATFLGPTDPWLEYVAGDPEPNAHRSNSHRLDPFDALIAQARQQEATP